MPLKKFLLAASLLADPLFVAAQAKPARPELAVLIMGGALPDMPNRAKAVADRQKMIDQTVAYLRRHSAAVIDVLADPDGGVTDAELSARLDQTAARKAKQVLLISLFDTETATRQDGALARTENRLLLQSGMLLPARAYYGLVARHLTPGGTNDPQLSILDYSCQGFASSDALTLTRAKRAAVFSTASKITSKDVNCVFQPPLSAGDRLDADELMTAALLAANADLSGDKGPVRHSMNTPRLLCMRPDMSDTLSFRHAPAQKYYTSGHRAGLVDPDSQLGLLRAADKNAVADAFHDATGKFLTDAQRKAALQQLYKVRNAAELRALPPDMADRVRAIGFAYGTAHPETQQSLLTVQVREKLQRYPAPALR